MSTRKTILLMTSCLLPWFTYAAKERAILFRNSVIVGYDDNTYSKKEKHGSSYISDLINLSTKLNFSSRTDMTMYWQQDARYRPDSDPKYVSYQDVYGRLSHAISPRTFLQVSDRLRYQEKGGQSGSVDADDQSYMENDLIGSLGYTINSVSSVKAGGGYLLRRWDDESYGKYDGRNNYDRYRGNASYIRQLRPNLTQGSIGLNYTDTSYEGSRGGYNSSVMYGGIDHKFNPNVSMNIQLGYSSSSIDNEDGSTDNYSPYFQSGLSYKPTTRTSITGSLGYSKKVSENSKYNVQDQYSSTIGLRHDLTAKINLSSSVSYICSSYDSDYSNQDESSSVYSMKDNYFALSLRASYRINRNNAIDVSYSYSDRNVDSDTDTAEDYDRNRVKIAWVLSL